MSSARVGRCREKPTVNESCEVNPPTAPDLNLVLGRQSPSMATLRIACGYVNQVVNFHNGGATGDGVG
jgi:hypothetical protein